MVRKLMALLSALLTGRPHWSHISRPGHKRVIQEIQADQAQRLAALDRKALGSYRDVRLPR